MFCFWPRYIAVYINPGYELLLCNLPVPHSEIHIRSLGFSSNFRYFTLPCGIISEIHIKDFQVEQETMLILA